MLMSREKILFIYQILLLAHKISYFHLDSFLIYIYILPIEYFFYLTYIEKTTKYNVLYNHSKNIIFWLYLN